MSPTRDRIVAQLQAGAREHVDMVCGEAKTQIEQMRELTADQRVRVEQIAAALDVVREKIAIRATGADVGTGEAYAETLIAQLGKLHTDAWFVAEYTLDMIAGITGKLEAWKQQQKGIN